MKQNTIQTLFSREFGGKKENAGAVQHLAGSLMKKKKVMYASK